MNTGNEDRRLADHSKNLFDASVDRLDAAALSRLNRARHAALEESGGLRRPAFGRFGTWVPVTGIVTAALVAVLVMRAPDELAGAADVVTTADFELLLDEESLEMFEDLEFYSWLESEDLATNGNVG